MEIAGATGTTSVSQEVNAFASMSSESFVRIMITELQNQDPFKPSDTSALLEQISSLRNIESQSMLQDQMGELVNQNQFATAGGLIGKMVEGTDTFGGFTRGLVASVRITNGQVLVELDNGHAITIEELVSITPPTSTELLKNKEGWLLHGIDQRGREVTGKVKEYALLGGIKHFLLEDGSLVAESEMKTLIDLENPDLRKTETHPVNAADQLTGKVVTGLTNSGNEVTGVVKEAEMVRGVMKLTLDDADGTVVELSTVDEIHSLPAMLSQFNGELLGTKVDGITTNNRIVSGVIRGIDVVDGRVRLLLDNGTLNADEVRLAFSA